MAGGKRVDEGKGGKEGSARGGKQRKLNDGLPVPASVEGAVQPTIGSEVIDLTVSPGGAGVGSSGKVAAVRGDVEATLKTMTVQGMASTKTFLTRIQTQDAAPPTDHQMRAALEEAWEENERAHRARRTAMLGLFRRHDHLSPAWLQAGVSRLKGGGRAGKGAPLLDLPDSLLCHIYGRAPARVCAHLAVCKRFASCLLRAESVELRVA